MSSKRLKDIAELFETIKGSVTPLPLEETEISRSFDIEDGEDEEILEGDKFEVKELSGNLDYTFSAFIDGTQRVAQTLWFKDPEKGLNVPIYIANISAGVLERTKSLKLSSTSYNLNRLVILMPLEGLEKANSKKIQYFKERLNSMKNDGKIVEDIEIDENIVEGIKVNQMEGPILFSDITYCGISKETRRATEDEERIKGKPLIGNNLYSPFLVKSRALTRVNVLRQILEMVVLAEYRLQKGVEPWIMVDGPLFLLGKWFTKHPILRTDNLVKREEKILKNTVGIIKSIRRRILNKYLDLLMNMDVGKRSSIVATRSVTDALGEDAEDLSTPHLSFFLRFRKPPWLTLPSHEGLIRIDIHRISLDLPALRRPLPEDASRKANLIATMTLNEAFPLPTTKTRILNEPYPIEEVEKWLRGGLYSIRELSYIHSIL